MILTALFTTAYCTCRRLLVSCDVNIYSDTTQLNSTELRRYKRTFTVVYCCSPHSVERYRADTSASSHSYLAGVAANLQKLAPRLVAIIDLLRYLSVHA